jgi:hypothetical protein
MLSKGTISLVVLAATLGLLATAAHAFDEKKYPDWSGQWQKVGDGGPPRYDPSKPNGRGQQAPLTDEYRRIHEASMKDQAAGGQGLYISSIKCIPMGMPYAMSIVFPFEFVITEKTTYILYEIMTSQPRRIYTDGRDWPKNPDPTFNGYSIGKWIDEDGDGVYDTLEIETRDMRVPRLFDQTGISFHSDGEGVIKERIHLDKAKPGIMYDEMTTIDHALTRPWSIKKTYRKLPTVVWPENNCTEGNSDVVIGKDHYMVGGDGLLMPIVKGQEPPDLRHFPQVAK